MIWLVPVLILLLIASAGTLLMYRWNVRKMTRQLEDIIENFGTNERIRTNVQNAELVQFITKVNQLISLYKEDQQMSQKKTKELKQEITNISHDLRTPLTSIKGFSDLLRDETLREAEKEEYLDIIQQKIDKLTMTVDLFYEVSKIESSDEQLEIRKISLEAPLVASILAFHQDFEARGIEVSIEEAQLSKPIWGDKKATERIIINIIQNALRYGETFFTLSARAEEDFLILKAANDTSGLGAEKTCMSSSAPAPPI